MNNKKKKKIILLMLGIISVVAISTTLLIHFIPISHQGEDSYSKNIRILNEQNVSIVIYGDEVNFRDGVKYEDAKVINESYFALDGKEFFVINDRLSNVSLRNEDYSTIKGLISDGVTFIYLGDSKTDTFKENNFFPVDYDIDSLGFMMSGFSSSDILNGVWNQNDEKNLKTNGELLGETIVETIVYKLKN